MLEWLRVIVRKKTRYMTPEAAHAGKARLSLLYAVLAWNIIGLTIYSLVKGSVPRNINDSVDYAKLLGVRDATVIKYSGLTKVSEFDIHLKEEEIEEFFTEPETDKDAESR